MTRALLQLLSILVLLPASLSAADRVALVIGNNKYTNLPPTSQLASPVADATDVAAALKELGYTIVTGAAVTDAGRDEILTATEAFTAAAHDAEAAVFYFSGHGVQVGEDNYLLASDTPKLTGLSVLKSRTVLLRDVVMVALEEAGAKNKAIILDCCRDNPFAAQLEIALAQVGKGIKTKSVGEITGYGPGFYLAFATSPGLTANDGNGQRNSPFTAAMLKSLPGGAGKDIDSLFRDVKLLLGDEQVSWTSHSLRTSFTLALAKAAKETTAPAPPGMTQAEIDRRVAEGIAAELARRQAMAPGSGTVAPPAGAARPAASVSSSRTAPPATPSTAVKEPAAGTTTTVPLPGGAKMTFCYCPSGTFTMGSPDTEERRETNEQQVQVRLSKGFWMAQTECTQGQWQAVMGSNPSKFTSDPALPVEQVNWTDAQLFLTRLNAYLKKRTAMTFVLPTEAQWEYACRAGRKAAFAFGNTLTTEQANFSSEGYYLAKTVRVASYPPNAWDLHDMHGNVDEWCQDAWDGKSNLPGGTDPLGQDGDERVLRGGYWMSGVTMCRSAFRNKDIPERRVFYVGLRVAAVPVVK